MGFLIFVAIIATAGVIISVTDTICNTRNKKTLRDIDHNFEILSKKISELENEIKALKNKND